MPTCHCINYGSGQKNCFATVDTIRYDSVYLTCSKKLTGSQLSLPHGINKKLKCETKLYGCPFKDLEWVTHCRLFLLGFSGVFHNLTFLLILLSKIWFFSKNVRTRYLAVLLLIFTTRRILHFLQNLNIGYNRLIAGAQKIHDLKMQDQMSWVENVGPESVKGWKCKTWKCRTKGWKMQELLGMRRTC